jgi:hypothetical protein
MQYRISIAIFPSSLAAKQHSTFKDCKSRQVRRRTHQPQQPPANPTHDGLEVPHAVIPVRFEWLSNVCDQRDMSRVNWSGKSDDLAVV